VFVIAALLALAQETAPEPPPPPPLPPPEALPPPPVEEPPSAVRHVPGEGIQIRASDRTRLRIRMLISPIFRTYNRSELLEDPDSVTWQIRRARLGFDGFFGQFQTRFDLQIKMTQLVFRQVYVAWKPNKHNKLFVGFLKPPGGLEVDSDVFAQPWSDRGAVTLFARVKQEVGVKIEGDVPRTPIFYAASITRPPRSNEAVLEEDEPEDQVPVPAIVEKNDLRASPERWNTAWRVGLAPSPLFEVSASGTVRFRGSEGPDEFDYSDNFAEPYDDPFFRARPWRGIGYHVKGDLGLALPHLRVLAAGGYRRDGDQVQILDWDTGVWQDAGGHLTVHAGSVTVGFTPVGHYGPAIANAPLLDGWELLFKAEAGRVKAVDSGPAWYQGLFGGLNWQATPQVRLQGDVAYQWFGPNAEGTEVSPAGHHHFVTNVWLVFRM
jgi:hypothetical protein